MHFQDQHRATVVETLDDQQLPEWALWRERAREKLRDEGVKLLVRAGSGQRNANDMAVEVESIVLHQNRPGHIKRRAHHTLSENGYLVKPCCNI